MAQMYPSQWPQGRDNRAERLLFHLLQDALPADWFVYHNMAYVESRRAAEGEADFVVLHAELGLLVIECKGKGVRFSPTTGWERCDGEERKPLAESPAAQAQRTVKDLAEELARRLPSVISGMDALPLTYGHCVALPEVIMGDAADAMPLPLDLPRLLWLDATDLQQLEARLRQIMLFWQRNRPDVQPMAPALFRRFRKHVLQPELRLVATMGAQIAGESAQLAQLTREQTAVIEGLAGMTQLRVIGGAGTGKTVLALEAARQAAVRGGDVLLLCFNAALGRRLAQHVEQLQAGPGRIVATSFHRLCHEAALGLGMQWQVPEAPEQRQRFWHEEAALILYEALDQGRLGPWDALIVDEAQDFLPAWWTALQHGLRTGEATRQVLFADPKQAVFGRPSALPNWPDYRLTRNLRNARCIAEVVAQLGDGAPLPSERSPEGEPPVVYALGAPGRMRKQLEQLLEQLRDRQGILPQQVALLSPHRRANSSLAGVEQLAGLPLVDRPEDAHTGWLHVTIGGYKGLEADVIILLDVRKDDERCDRAARYVAASRARHRLYVFADCDWLN